MRASIVSVFKRIMLLQIEFVVCKWYPVHLLYTECLIAGEIKTIGGGIRVPWTLSLVVSMFLIFAVSQASLVFQESFPDAVIENTVSTGFRP